MEIETRPQVRIDGTDYVPRNQTLLTDEAMKLLSELYGKIWCEAIYDPDNEQSRVFAKKCLSHIQRLNELLKFKS